MFRSNKAKLRFAISIVVSAVLAANGNAVGHSGSKVVSAQKKSEGNFSAAESFHLSPVSEKKASSFALPDQFGKNISVKFPSDKAVVLVFGDREGSEQIEGWVRPIYGKFTNKIYIFGIAELSAVPWIARPVVRGIIKSKSKNPIMLDWSGKVSKSYGYQKGKANLYVVSKNGVIVAEKRGAATSSSLNELYDEINSIL